MIRNTAVRARLTTKASHQTRHDQEPRSSSGAAIKALMVSKSRAGGSVQRSTSEASIRPATVAIVMTAAFRDSDWDFASGQGRSCAGEYRDCQAVRKRA